MKKNKGFTLVEILAVVVIISAIALISVPSIINYINNSKNKISDVTQKLIFTGANLYLDDSTLDDKFQKTYCVTLKEIVDRGYLEAPIIDSVNNKEINLNKFLKATLEYDDDLQKHKFNYEIVDECEIEKFLCAGADDNEITTGNVPKGNFTPGDEYICEVKDGTKYNFFVLSTEDDKINLIMDSNITYDGKPIKSTSVIEAYSEDEWNKWHTAWISKSDYAQTSGTNNGEWNSLYGPITALNYIDVATSSWDNIPNLDETYTEEGNRYDPITLTGKARMPKKSEIDNLFVDKIYSMDNFRLDMLPIWATNYLYNDESSLSNASQTGTYVKGRTHVDNLGTYWLLDTYNDAYAFDVGFDAGVYGKSTVVTDKTTICNTYICLYAGIRPVIEVDKTQIIN